MATTTNYGWTTPDDTALVKDGAAAIRTLGSSVDTTTKALNPSTTLGDIEYRSSTANTNTRLGIGSTGQVLTVAGGVPSWATPAAAGGMTLISTTTFSGASVDLTTISGSYKHLFLQWYGLTNNTANAYLDMRLNNNSGSVYNCYRDGTSNTSVFQQGETSSTYLRTTAGNLDRTSSNNAGNMWIYNYASSTNYKLVAVQMGFRAPSTTNAVHLTNCLFLSNTAVDQVNFFLDNGATFSAGEVKLYGVN
jgi:hypothetical protein